MEITNQLKKYVRSLHATKHRQKYDKFIAEGPKICEEFINNSKFELEYLFCNAEWYDNNTDLTRKLPSSKVCIVKEKELSQISCLKTPNKVLLVLDRKPSVSTDLDFLNWSIYLDKIQDPGNMGTILRIADWYGISLVMASPDSVDYYNPKVVQSAMGAHNRVEFLSLPVEKFLEKEIPKYALVLEGTNIGKLHQPSPGSIIIGNESKGISDQLKYSCGNLITIPRYGKAESLNASVACGIACHVLLNN